MNMIIMTISVIENFKHLFSIFELAILAESAGWKIAEGTHEIKAKRDFWLSTVRIKISICLHIWF